MRGPSSMSVQNTGIYSLLAARANALVEVIAFEPVAATCAQARRLVEMNGLADRIELRCEAVSNVTGISDFHVPNDGFPTMASLDPAGRRGLAGTLDPGSDRDSGYSNQR